MARTNVTPNTLHLLGFSACTLPACDCGARVVIGVSRAAARRLYQVLREAGFDLEQVAITRGDKTADQAEPFTPTARAEFGAYCTEAPHGQ